MQRRAVAVYAALFVLVAGVAGVLTVTADSPEIGFENPDYEVSDGETIEVEGQEYVVEITEVEESGGGGHGGGGGGTSLVATIERNMTVEQSEAWANGSTVQFNEREWRVEITGEDPSEFTLVEVPDRQAILEADPQADNETVQRDDGEYVVVTEDGESSLIPVGEYFPAPEERSYATGGTLEYSSQTATVDNVTADQAVLVWEATETESIEVQDEGIVTLVETDLVAHFADSSTLHLSSDIEGYDAQVAEIEQFEQYNSGLTRVVILALFSIVLLLSAAFIPSRY
ncbi:hypothetical protein [Halorubrum lacusprofundi]|jgi:hypothetical protein|uniref:Uncharacterized protein n=1 Tax=Halorubrum lacusprofundi (strain ATCC 49239 / DSM 5036 / JCM 8891 / ACAM 34) TaxID=416348 RepID=B9LQM8_HALLT|nr:conserved hypothetical protein [Halorubrum lacusprofundi ATCC 49239]